MPHAKCVVCHERPSLRHFACEACLEVPELNHNVVGAYLKGVCSYLEGDSKNPYEARQQEVNGQPTRAVTYALVYLKWWRKGFERAGEVGLRECVERVYGDSWRLYWEDRVVPVPGYLGHGRFKRRE